MPILFFSSESHTHSWEEQRAVREPQFGYVALSPTSAFCLSSYSTGICPQYETSGVWMSPLTIRMVRFKGLEFYIRVLMTWFLEAEWNFLFLIQTWIKCLDLPHDRVTCESSYCCKVHHETTIRRSLRILTDHVHVHYWSLVNMNLHSEARTPRPDVRNCKWEYLGKVCRFFKGQIWFRKK
jgi:hypothetical protein